MIEPEVEPRHREAAVLAVRGPECNPNERGTALHWARTGMTYLENAYAAEERVARMFAVLEANGGEWRECPRLSEFVPAHRDMPPSGEPVLFVHQAEFIATGRMGWWDASRGAWIDARNTGIEYAPREVSHWRPYPDLPEAPPRAIESTEVASG